MQFNKFLNFFLIILIFGCRKKSIQQNDVSNIKDAGYLVLNEGLFNQNNATLTWYDVESNSITEDVFQTKNERGLGDTGNDLIRYGNKIYVVVNVSSTIEVLDAKTLVSLKQIPMINDAKPKQPRNIVGYGNKVYVSCFDGYIDVIDTVSFQILNRIKVGLNPENLCVVNQQLFVSNSGGLNPPKMDSTISVIDLNSDSEIKKIVLGVNPGTIIKGLNNTIYAITRGNYNDISPQWKLLNFQTGTIEKVFKESILSLELFQDTLLLVNQDNKYIKLFSMQLNEYKNTNFISLENFVNPYNIQYFLPSKEICVTDANGYVNQGYVFVFDEIGKLKLKFKSGLNPSKIIRYE